MKKIFLPVLILSGIFCFVTPLYAAEDTLFHDANAKYQAGDYKAAMSLYQQIASSGKATAIVYYNLGNASFRAGNKGAALVAYERARALNPRDRDVEWNKGVLKNALSDRIEDADDNVFLSSVQRLLEWVTVDEAGVVFSLFLGILFLFSLLHFIFHKAKPLTGGVAGFFLFLWILSGAVFYFKWLEIRDPRVVVLDREVSARYGPSDKETKAFTLHEGAEAKVADQTGDWFYISLKNKNTGWIPKKSCEII